MKELLLIFLLPISLFAQTAIYRSVQPGVTAAIGTGTGTLTISGSTATFSVSQPDSIGVGDAIQYDSDGNSSIDAIAFIHGRTSSTVYTVAAANGGTPTGVSGDEDHDIFRAYTSLQNCDDGIENSGIDATVRNFDSGNRDIITANEIWRVACYNGTNGNYSHNGWTDSPTNYFEIFTPYLESEVGTPMRHNGVFGGRTFKISATSGFAVTIASTGGSSYGLKLDGLTIISASSSGRAVDINAFETGAKVWVSNCLISQTATGSSYGIYGAQDADRTVYVFNNIIVAGASDAAIFLDDNAGTFFIFNNTIVVGGALSRGINRSSITGNAAYSINNIIQVTSGTSTACFQGSFHASSNFNLSSDDTAPGASSIINTLLTFANSGAQNYHLTSADAAIAVGTDLSEHANLPFSTDIDGDTRTTWNMGADEFQSSQNYYRRRLVE